MSYRDQVANLVKLIVHWDNCEEAMTRVDRAKCIIELKKQAYELGNLLEKEGVTIFDQCKNCKS